MIVRTMRLVRAVSLVLVARKSTMRLPKHLPRRTMAPVVSVFKTSLVAVPALRRVEPLNTSGPTTGRIIRSTCESSSDSVLHTRPIVVAPTDRA